MIPNNPPFFPRRQAASRAGNPALEAWEVLATGYPARAGEDERLRFLLNYAVLAPSSHNTQPWRFDVHDGGADLRADRAKRLPVADPDDRELLMSCGAALFHLRVAIRYFGHDPDVGRFPDPEDPDLLARVRLGAPREPHLQDHLLFQAVPARHSHRTPFDPRPLEEELVDRLVKAAGLEGATLHPLQDEASREAVSDLQSEADRALFSDAAYRRELASWMRANRDRRPEGIPGYAFGFGALASRAAPTALRHLNLWRSQARKDRARILAAPHLAVIATPGDAPRDWVAAGEAADHVLLRAVVAGVHGAVMSGIMEVPSLREDLRGLLGSTGHPQVLLMLGHGTEPPPSPRRPADEVGA